MDRPKFRNDLLRPFAFAASAMAAGVFFAYAALFLGVPLGFGFLTLLFPLACVLFSARKGFAVFCFFLFLLFLSLGMGGFSWQIRTYETQNIPQGEYTLTGEVEECTEGQKYAVLLLKNVTVSDGTLQTEAEGRVKVYVYVSDYTAKTGEVVEGQAWLYPVGSPYRYHVFRAETVAKNIRYTASAYEEPQSTSFRFHLFSALSEKIKEVLFDNLTYDTAGAAYAMTTGNTSLLDEELLSSVRYGGVAHLFAVSGMHIGVVFALAAWLLKRLRLPSSWPLPPALRRALKSALPLLVCLLFCGICNFTASSLRALFILTFATAVRLVCLRADRVELIAAAALFLLCLSPASLFSAGYLLSFSAFAGATVLAPNVLRSLQRKGFFPKNALATRAVRFLTVTLSVQLAIFPAQLAFFGYASLWSVLLNFVFLPLFSLFFPLLLAGILLACAFPASAGVFFFLPSFFLQFFVFVFSAADLSSVLVCGFSLATAGIVAWYALLVLQAKKYKRGGELVSCFLIALLLVDTYFNGTALSVDCKVTQRCYYNNFVCALVQTREKTVLIMNGGTSYSDLSAFLYRHTAYLDGVVIVSDDPASAIHSLLSFPFGDVYLGGNYATGLQTHTVHTERVFSVGEIDFEYVGEGLLFSYGGVTGSFQTDLRKADFTVFYSEPRDGLIFSIKGGILSLNG